MVAIGASDAEYGEKVVGRRKSECPSNAFAFYAPWVEGR
jgi:hypothetical protein